MQEGAGEERGYSACLNHACFLLLQTKAVNIHAEIGGKRYPGPTAVCLPGSSSITMPYAPSHLLMDLFLTVLSVGPLCLAFLARVGIEAPQGSA